MHQHWENLCFFAEDPNTKWEIWKKLFLEVLNRHAPLQHKKIRAKKPLGSRVQQKNLLIHGTNLKEKPLLQTLNVIGKIIRELGIE